MMEGGVNPRADYSKPSVAGELSGLAQAEAALTSAPVWGQEGNPAGVPGDQQPGAGRGGGHPPGDGCSCRPHPARGRVPRLPATVWVSPSFLPPGTRAAGPFTDGALSPCRSTPDVPPCVTFDESLLEEGEPLEPGELQLNELTVESVQHTCVVARHRAGLAGVARGGRRLRGAAARLAWLCGDASAGHGARLSHGPSSGHRLTSVTDELAVATQTVLSRQEAVAQLQRELRSEEQNTHPRER